MPKEVAIAEDDMIAVTYISHSLIKSSEADEVCADIKKVASEKNRLSEISGVLLFRRNRFIQRLEGIKSAIDPLIEVIKSDKRHRNFTILFYGKITERCFKDWSQMEVVTQGTGFDELDQMFLNLESGGREILNDQESRFILNFIQHYKD